MVGLAWVCTVLVIAVLELGVLAVVGGVTGIAGGGVMLGGVTALTDYAYGGADGGDGGGERGYFGFVMVIQLCGLGLRKVS